MDWNSIFVNVLPSIISGIVGFVGAYLTYKNKVKDQDVKLETMRSVIDSKFIEMQKSHDHKIELMEKELELKIKEQSNEFTNQLTEKTLTGEMDFNKMGEQLQGLSKMLDILPELEKKSQNTKKVPFN